MIYNKFHYPLTLKLSTVCICLWFLLCVFYSIDTKSFVYLSLSQTLCGGACILFLGWVTILIWIKRRVCLVNNRIQLASVIWCLYMLFHAYIITPPEFYRLMYLEVTLALFVILPFLIRNGLLPIDCIEKGIILMTLIQISTLTLQSFHLISSYDIYFPLTGCSENPNSTAIMLVLSLPVLLKRVQISKKGLFYFSIFVIALVFVFTLKCRTAFLGLLAYVITRALCMSQFRLWWKKHTIPIKIVLGILSVVLLLTCLCFLYQAKQRSSEGRLLIWNVSSSIIQNTPMGVGVGMFQRYYNLQQGEYFASGNSLKEEQSAASIVYMAYNDFIECGVETGLIGFAIMIVLYISLLIQAYKLKNYYALSIIVAVILMSNVNFFYLSIKPWVAWIALMSCLLSKSGNLSKEFSSKKILFSPLVGIYWFCLSVALFEMLISQYKYQDYRERISKGEILNIKTIETLSPNIRSSESYWRFLSNEYIKRGNYEKALLALEEANHYITSANLYYSFYRCYEKMEMPEMGIPYINMIRKMIPQNLSSRHFLMKWYDKHGNRKEAILIATEIINTPIKIRNKQSDAIQFEASEYLKKSIKE